MRSFGIFFVVRFNMLLNKQWVPDDLRHHDYYGMEIVELLLKPIFINKKLFQWVKNYSNDSNRI